MSDSGRWLVAAAGVLLAACMGRSYLSAAAPSPASSVAATSVAQDLPDGAGKEVVERLCSGCHDLMFTMSTREDAEGWARIVDDMRSRGTDGTEAEFDAVIAYLAAHMGPAGPAPAPAPHATLQILANRTKVAPGEHFALGLRVEAADGWHMNADTAPEVTWDAPLLAVGESVRSAGQTPPAFTVFPATVATSAESGATIAITVRVTYDVCQEACLTMTSTTSLQLPVGDGGEPDHADAFAIPR